MKNLKGRGLSGDTDQMEGDASLGALGKWFGDMLCLFLEELENYSI